MFSHVIVDTIVVFSKQGPILEHPFDFEQVEDFFVSLFFDRTSFENVFLDNYSSGPLRVAYYNNKSIVKSFSFLQNCPEGDFDEKKNSCLCCLAQMLADEVITRI